MDLNVSIEDNRYMEKFFRKFPQYEEEVKENIYQKLPDIILHRPHKIKPAYHLKRNNQTIYEYKVIVKMRISELHIRKQEIMFSYFSSLKQPSSGSLSVYWKTPAWSIRGKRENNHTSANILAILLL